MKLRSFFDKTNKPKHSPPPQMSPLLRAMAAEIPRWPPQKRPLMEKIVIEAAAAGVSSMDEFSAFLDSHPDLRTGFYATVSEAFGPEGKQMLSALEALEEPPMSAPVTGGTMQLGNDTVDLSEEGFETYFNEHPEKAIELSTMLLEEVRTRGDRFSEAVILGQLGIAHARLNQLRKAIYYFERHLEISRELGNWQWYMEDYRNLGRAYFELGDDERAEAIYAQAVQIARQQNDREWDIEHSLCLASVYARQGDMQRAAELKNHATKLRNQGAT
jgi:tetratricopeptide (TPR) repeat protein